MKVLFITSEHPGALYGGLGTFTREYVKELRKVCEVKCVYLHLKNGRPLPPDQTVDVVLEPRFAFEAFSPDAKILEVAGSFRAQLDPLIKSFKPDVIHCNDRQTYMPFRFDENVFYSSHLIYTDLISGSLLNDVYFQEVKVERCSMGTSAIVAAYSRFAAEKAVNVAGGLCSPVVLPLGIDCKRFMKTEKERKAIEQKKKIRVSFFGRFVDAQKGINDFIYAVNGLGRRFKEKHNVEYSLYGHGDLARGIDLSLFDNIKFVQGNDLTQAYKTSDIVVMPSRYEPFGFTGLEAMAAGCLLLVPRGQGMDMYARPDFNCLEISDKPDGLIDVLEMAVEKISRFGEIRENAVRTAKEWTWTRCVKAHMYFYEMIKNGRSGQVFNAYRLEANNVLDSYEKVSDVEKVYRSEKEKRACQFVYRNFFENSFDENEGKGKKILFVTGSYLAEDDELPEGVKAVSVLLENADGVIIRPECLPFEDGEFDSVVACGSWETVINPCNALIELQRVSKGDVMILSHSGVPHSWQTFQMEGNSDWKKLTSSEWNCLCGVEKKMPVFDEPEDFKIVRYLKNAVAMKSENFA